MPYIPSVPNIDPKIIAGVDGDIIDAHLKMTVRSGGISGRADIGDELPPLHGLPLVAHHTAAMSI